MSNPSTTTFPRMHVSLYVSSIDETVAFYDRFFGQPAAKVKPGYAKYLLNEPSLIISFVENEAKVKDNFGHLGFQVATQDLLSEWKSGTTERGVPIALEETQTACCYALQDKFWVNDPDGVRWEVYYFHEDAEVNDADPETGACCSPDMVVATSGTGEKAEEACCVPGSGCC